MTNHEKHGSNAKHGDEGHGQDDEPGTRPFGPEVAALIDRLVAAAGEEIRHADGSHRHASGRRNSLVEDMVRTSLRLLGDGTDLG